MEEEKNNRSNIFLFLSLFVLFFAILISFYFFYIKKDFNFVLEFPCNSSEEECFVRDCESEGVCPPNNLSEFKRYIVNGSDFKKCEKEDCLSMCINGEIDCEQISCEEDSGAGEYCSVFKNDDAVLE
jgi:hypothetical protein